MNDFLSDNLGRRSLMRLGVFVIICVMLFDISWVVVKTNAIPDNAWQAVLGMIGGLWMKERQKPKEQ